MTTPQPPEQSQPASAPPPAPGEPGQPAAPRESDPPATPHESILPAKPSETGPPAGPAEAGAAVDNPWQRPADDAAQPGDHHPATAPGQAPAGQPVGGMWPGNQPAAGAWPGAGAQFPGAMPAGRRSAGPRPFLVGGGVGLLAGALVVGILWAASSFVTDDGNGADADAAAACGVFERVPDEWQIQTMTEQTTYQLGGAVALAQAAGKADDDYRVLAAQTQQVQQAVVTFNFDRVAQLVVDVRNTCDDL